MVWRILTYFSHKHGFKAMHLNAQGLPPLKNDRLKVFLTRIK